MSSQPSPDTNQEPVVISSPNLTLTDGVAHPLEVKPKVKKDIKFWLVIFAMCVSTFLAAIDLVSRSRSLSFISAVQSLAYIERFNFVDTSWRQLDGYQHRPSHNH